MVSGQIIANRALIIGILIYPHTFDHYSMLSLYGSCQRWRSDIKLRAVATINCAAL